ncbi:MAG: GYF domain-containing protein [Bacteroidia bacterium]|nr:GYF domain-containing protein [Bacteroidia bacterium]
MNRYFYIDSEGKQKGTFSPEELKVENIRKDTLVWTQGMSEWMRAADVAELNYLFEVSSSFNSSQPPAQQVTAPPVQQVNYNNSYSHSEPAPKSWLVESILATVLPFLLCGSFLSLLGIIGIVNASKVESLYARGDYAGSLEASKQAGRWTKIALWISVAWIVLWILAVILIIALGVSMASVGDIIGNSGYEV